MSARPTILVIEFSPAGNESLAGILREADYDVVSTASPDDARAQVATSIDLIVSELRPDTSQGRDLLEYFHAKRPDTPYLVVAESDGHAAAAEAIRLGAADYISRPFRREELLNRVSAHATEHRNVASQEEISHRFDASTPADAGAKGEIVIPRGMTLDDLERVAIEQALQQHQGNRTHAAKSLGISVRTLQRKLKSWRASNSPVVDPKAESKSQSGKPWSPQNNPSSRDRSYRARFATV